MEKKKPTLEEYTKIIQNCIDAWNNADAELIASFYADDFEFSDPTIPHGISNKENFIKYLKFIFKTWPYQKWILKNIMPHSKAGAFSLDYRFKIANNEKSIQGFGMDRIEFDGTKVKLNHVYLNAIKWIEWMENELKK